MSQIIKKIIYCILIIGLVSGCVRNRTTINSLIFDTTKQEIFKKAFFEYSISNHYTDSSFVRLYCSDNKRLYRKSYCDSLITLYTNYYRPLDSPEVNILEQYDKTKFFNIGLFNGKYRFILQGRKDILGLYGLNTADLGIFEIDTDFWIKEIEVSSRYNIVETEVIGGKNCNYLHRGNVDSICLKGKKGCIFLKYQTLDRDFSPYYKKIIFNGNNFYSIAEKTSYSIPYVWIKYFYKFFSSNDERSNNYRDYQLFIYNFSKYGKIININSELHLISFDLPFLKSRGGDKYETSIFGIIVKEDKGKIKVIGKVYEDFENILLQKDKYKYPNICLYNIIDTFNYQYQRGKYLPIR